MLRCASNWEMLLPDLDAICARVDAFARSWISPRATRNSQPHPTLSHSFCIQPSPHFPVNMSRDETPLVRDVPDDEAYTYVHRVFLQSFFTHGVMTVDEMKPILAAVMTAHGKAPLFTDKPLTDICHKPQPPLPRRRCNPTRPYNALNPNHQLSSRTL